MAVWRGNNGAAALLLRIALLELRRRGASCGGAACKKCLGKGENGWQHVPRGSGLQLPRDRLCGPAQRSPAGGCLEGDQLAHSAGRAQLADGLGLDLADALAGDLQNHDRQSRRAGRKGQPGSREERQRRRQPETNQPPPKREIYRRGEGRKRGCVGCRTRCAGGVGPPRASARAAARCRRGPTRLLVAGWTSADCVYPAKAPWAWQHKARRRRAGEAAATAA